MHQDGVFEAGGSSRPAVSAGGRALSILNASVRLGANTDSGRTVYGAEIACRLADGQDPAALDRAVAIRLAERLPASTDVDLPRLGRRFGLADLIAVAVAAVERAAVPRILWSAEPSRAMPYPLADGMFGVRLRWHPVVPAHAAAIVEAALVALDGVIGRAAPGSAAAFRDRLAGLRTRIAADLPPPDGQRLLAAARDRGLPAERIAGPHLRIGQGRRQVHLYDSMPAATSYGAVRRLGDRDRVWAVWRGQGLPVPAHRIVGSRDDLRAAAAAIGLPVVVQPIKTLAAADRTVLVDSPDRLGPAYRRAAGRSGPALVRTHPAGELYRLVIVGRRMVAAAWVRDGAARDVTDRVDPDVQILAVTAARSLGLAVAGIDLVTPDIGRPRAHAPAVLLEATGRPALDLHHAPAAGPPRDVAGAILDSLFDGPDRAHLPVLLAVGDAPAAEAVARAVRACLQAAGYGTGLCLDHRTELDGEPLDGVPAGGAWGLRALAREPYVDALVAGLSPETVIDQGLGVMRCRAAALIGPIGTVAGQAALAAMLNAGVDSVLVPPALLAEPEMRPVADRLRALSQTAPEGVAAALLADAGLEHPCVRPDADRRLPLFAADQPALGGVHLNAG